MPKRELRQVFSGARQKIRSVGLLALLLIIGCGRVQSDGPSDAEGVVDSSSDSETKDDSGDAVTDAPRFDSGAGCPPYLPSGKCDTLDKRCVFIDRCIESTDSSTTVQCVRKGTDSSLEWTVVGGIDCWRLLDADGCPAGGVIPGEYCETVGQSCSYPRQCSRYKAYQVPTCVRDDVKGGVWSATEKGC